MSALLWRIEDRTGVGPYQSGLYSMAGVEGDYGCPQVHRRPSEDPLKVTGDHGVVLADPRTDRHLFGFSDLTTARKWWYSLPDLILWEGLGARIAAYRREDCTGVHETLTQAIFIPGPGPRALACATYLHRLSMHSLTQLMLDQLPA